MLALSQPHCRAQGPYPPSVPVPIALGVSLQPFLRGQHRLSEVFQPEGLCLWAVPTSLLLCSVALPDWLVPTWPSQTSGVASGTQRQLLPSP